MPLTFNPNLPSLDGYCPHCQRHQPKYWVSNADGESFEERVVCIVCGKDRFGNEYPLPSRYEATRAYRLRAQKTLS